MDEDLLPAVGCPDRKLATPVHPHTVKAGYPNSRVRYIVAEPSLREPHHRGLPKHILT